MMHPSGSHSAVEAPPALAGLTALVVDDESYLRDVVGAILRHHGMGVIAAESVPEAWSVLHRDSVDCLVSDLQLPGQGGLELIAMVRASERAVLHSLPAIAMSGRGDPESQQVALARGFDAFLAKPFRAAVLVDRVCEALAQHLVP